MFENESRQVELSEQMWTNREKMIRNLPESSLVRLLGETGRNAAAQTATALNGGRRGGDDLIEESKNAEFEENLKKVSVFFFL